MITPSQYGLFSKRSTLPNQSFTFLNYVFDATTIRELRWPERPEFTTRCRNRKLIFILFLNILTPQASTDIPTTPVFFREFSNTLDPSRKTPGNCTRPWNPSNYTTPSTWNWADGTSMTSMISSLLSSTSTGGGFSWFFFYRISCLGLIWWLIMSTHCDLKDEHQVSGWE